MALCAAPSFLEPARGSYCRKVGRTNRTWEVCMIWLRTLVASLVCVTLAEAGDWPGWLGPNRDGSSSETIAAWKETPKVLWRQPVGEGNKSPVVANGRVFVHAQV